MEGLEGELVLGLNQAPSMNAVLRALKKEEASMFCCVASIAQDAQFVQQVAGRYPSLPLFANLRCGLWYLAPPVQHTCYFKSTDGHNNNWSFSTVRLNLHVAAAAAAAGGSLVVDATKRGKRFPDAMSKTIPIWAAVMNRAVARLRGSASGGTPAGSAGEAACAPSTSGAAAAAAAAAPEAAAAPAAPAAPAAVPWDCEVHLPPWVSEVEADSIRQRLEGWTDQLLEVGAALSSLVTTLRKPLRCIWVSQDTGAWQCGEDELDALAFTPLVLIGASATTARHTRCLQLPPERPGEEPLSVSYRYFPGAADDEESWSQGLSPPLMWRHLHALLAAGPSGVEALAGQLVEQAQQQQGQQGSAAQGLREGPAEAATANGSVQAGEQQQQQQQQQQQAQPGMAGASLRAVHVQAPGQAALKPQPAAGGPASSAVALSGVTTPVALQSLLQQPASSGLHCLLPQGCHPVQAAAVQQVGSGIYLLGDTRLAISSAAAAAAPAVWQHTDAVLYLGTRPVAGMAQAQQSGQEEEQQSGQQQQQQPGQQQQQHKQQEATAGQQDVHAPAAAQPSSTGSLAAGGNNSAAACRYCWLSVRCAKQDRHSLQQQLPAALRFAGAQLEVGRRLLVSCDSGLDASVCTALACLLAFYRLDLQPGGGTGLAYVGPTAAAAAAAPGGPPAGSGSNSNGTWLGSPSSSDATAPGPPAPEFPPLVGQAGFSKLAVRQHLAALTAHYPAARPTRGSIKQVFNFFLGQLGGSADAEE